MFKLFNKYFIPTLLGMLSMSAVTAIDGIFVGHGVGSDGVAAINICIPVLMLLMGVAQGVPSWRPSIWRGANSGSHG